MKNVVILLLGLFAVSISTHGQGLRFKTLQAVAQKNIREVGEEDFNSMVQVRPNGDIEYLSILHGNKDQWILSVIDITGKTTIDKVLIGEYSVSAQTYNYSWRWIENSRKDNVILTENSERLYLHKFNYQGKEMLSNEYRMYVPENPVLVENMKGDLYTLGWFAPAVSQTIDLFRIGEKTADKRVPLIDLSVQPLFSDVRRVQATFCAAVTDDDNIMICLRSEFVSYTWDDKAAYYCLYDFNGKELAKIREINIKAYAACKVKNFALPGSYGYNYSGYDQKEKKVLRNQIAFGYDVVKLPNGQLILLVTAFDDDKTSLCTYLINFDKDGNLIKPDVMKTIDSKPIGDGVFPVNRAGWTSISTYRSSAPMKYDLVLYSFDEDGNLFTEKIPLGEFRNR
jgi:hypothetical protein